MISQFSGALIEKIPPYFQWKHKEASLNGSSRHTSRVHYRNEFPELYEYSVHSMLELVRKFFNFAFHITSLFVALFDEVIEYPRSRMFMQ